MIHQAVQGRCQGRIFTSVMLDRDGSDQSAERSPHLRACLDPHSQLRRVWGHCRAGFGLGDVNAAEPGGNKKHLQSGCHRKAVRDKAATKRMSAS